MFFSIHKWTEKIQGCSLDIMSAKKHTDRLVGLACARHPELLGKRGRKIIING